MNRWTLLFHPCLIATVLTLAIAQDPVTATCISPNNCNYHAYQSEKYYREDERSEHPYKTGITIMVITLITTKIAKSALKSWLVKP
ncbi:hypothetical protein [Nostoc sp. 106C]|jgi:hypothetical protein|uniref:hypothetical protein n=1 Tax=Nostoc sp. 106C TaxID=1932667 RepID=UPI000A377441|nr:hypothetical protein [Nostoc sp. 106C]OUL19970.1 hypothetical protein BV378_30950 [Nostoc sp. RF31YmG]OUL21617.1 hypothetical protein BV375_29220 [Nostoc sp. 106C]